MAEANRCWNCHADPGGGLFCASCGTLQPPQRDYFQFFGIPSKLDLNIDELQRRFYDLSRQLHPDRFTRKAAEERQYSLDATAVLNDAWRTLREPVSRAEYVLTQAGLEIAEQRSKDVPPELLEEVFELNMALEELRGGDPSARPQLVEARDRFLGMRQEIDNDLIGLFRQHDEADGDQRQRMLSAIRGVLNRRRYIGNLIREVEKELNGNVSN